MGGDVVESVAEVLTAEANNHLLTLILARERLVGGAREVKVLRADVHGVGEKLALDESGSIDEDGDARHSLDEISTIDENLRLIVGGDDATVLGILTFGEAADVAICRGLEDDVARTERDAYHILRATEDALEDIRRLLVENETCSLVTGLDVCADVARHLVAVGCDKRDLARLDVEIDAVHDRVEIVIGGSEERGGDAREERILGDLDAADILLVDLLLWIVIGSDAYLVGFAGEGGYFESERTVWDRESYWLLGEILDIFSKLDARDTDFAIALHIVDFEGRGHSHLGIGGRKDEEIALYGEEEIGEDRERSLVIDNLTHSLEA